MRDQTSGVGSCIGEGAEAAGGRDLQGVGSDSQEEG